MRVQRSTPSFTAVEGDGKIDLVVKPILNHNYSRTVRLHKRLRLDLVAVAVVVATSCVEGDGSTRQEARELREIVVVCGLAVSASAGVDGDNASAGCAATGEVWAVAGVGA